LTTGQKKTPKPKKKTGDATGEQTAEKRDSFCVAEYGMPNRQQKRENKCQKRNQLRETIEKKNQNVMWAKVKQGAVDKK